MPVPIIIGILIVFYMIVWINSLFFLDAPEFPMTLFGVPILTLLLLWMRVIKEQLDEIRSGEEDDPSKY